MELKLQRSLVLQELSILQGVVEHRTTIPILSSIPVRTRSRGRWDGDGM